MWRVVIFLTINIYSFCQTKDIQNIDNIIEINDQLYELKEGDIFFQDLDSSPLCDAIEKVTKGINNKDLSHVGICIIENSHFYILEAFTHGVKMVKIEEFLKRSVNSDGNPKIIIGRLKPEYKNLIQPAIKKGKKLIGKEYDELFIIGNDKYYCSELIYEMFLTSEGGLFELKPMTFVDPESKEFLKIWLDYFEKLSYNIPEGMPGLNPGGMSFSKNIDIIYDLEKN